MLFVRLFMYQICIIESSALRKSSKRAISTTRFTGSLQFAEQGMLPAHHTRSTFPSMMQAADSGGEVMLGGCVVLLRRAEREVVEAPRTGMVNR